MPRNQPKRHHYVAEVYQRGFADVDECLWVYDRRAQRFKKLHPRVICCENDLYTLDPQGVQNSQIESKWLSQIDGEGATAIRNFESGIQLDQEWRESFSIFMAQQITRTPVFRELTIQNYRAMGEEFLRIGFTDVERARQFLERYREQTGDRADTVTAESLVEAVVGGHLRLTVNEGPFLRHMLKQVEFLARWIAAFDWQVVKAPKGTGFILCDYPFVVVPPEEHPDAVGLGFRGAVKYFPLTRRLCLRMTDPGYGFSYVKTSKEGVRIINQNVAVNSERFIMGPIREQLEHVIARSNTAAPDPAPRTVVEAIQSDRDSALYRFNFWPRRQYFYPKS